MSALLQSRLFEGVVRHRRLDDKNHAFQYPLRMMFLDLAEVSALPEILPWGGKAWSPRSFRREDYLSPEVPDLSEAVRDRVAKELGFRPEGRIVLLTQLRSFGYLFMPVSFYLCHDQEGELAAVVAEITNTPWRERHAYVLDARAESATAARRWEFDKVFHVSPFHGMDHVYRWRLQLRGNRLVVAMVNMRKGKKVFSATLSGQLTAANRKGMVRQIWRSPLQSQRLHFAIYLQALILFLKRASFHRHPLRAAKNPHDSKQTDHVHTHSR